MVDIIDLTEDRQSTGSPATEQILTKKEDVAAVENTATVSTPAPEDGTDEAPVVVETVAASTATPAAIPTTPAKNALWDVPELAERYVPSVSTEDNVVYRSPKQFSLKPPYWEKWQQHEYTILSEYLEGVDLIPISRQLKKPVQEVWYMMTSVVTRPLMDAREASRRGVGGIEAWFQTFKQCGTPQRKWGPENIMGEMDKASENTIHLVLEDGTKGSITADELTDADRKWVDENVPRDDQLLVYGRETDDDEEEKLPARNKTRSWTVNNVRGRYDGSQMRKVVILLENGKRMSLPLADLTQDDRDWLNSNIPDLVEDSEEAPGLITSASITPKPLNRQTTTPTITLPETDDEDDEGDETDTTSKFRKWTADEITGRYAHAAYNQITISTKNGGTSTITRNELTTYDKDYLHNTLTKDELKVIVKGKEKAPMPVVSSSAALNENLRSAIIKLKLPGKAAPPAAVATKKSTLLTAKEPITPPPSKRNPNKRSISESDDDSASSVDESPTKRKKASQRNQNTTTTTNTNPILLPNAPGPLGARSWTNDGIVAVFDSITRHQLHLREEERGTSPTTLAPPQLNKQDQVWLKANVKKEWIRVFTKGDKMPVVKRGRAGGDDDDEYDEDGDCYGE